MISFKNSSAFRYNTLISNDLLMLFHYKTIDMFVKYLNYNKEDKKVQYTNKGES